MPVVAVAALGVARLEPAALVVAATAQRHQQARQQAALEPLIPAAVAAEEARTRREILGQAAAQAALVSLLFVI